MQSSSRDELLIVTSDEWFEWWSMREVIPAAERSWMHLSRHGVPVKCTVIRNGEAASSWIPKLARARWIVVTCMTRFTARVVRTARLGMAKDAPLFLYVNGDATFAFSTWDLSGRIFSLFNTRDTFVVSSEADVGCVRACFANARVRRLYYPITRRASDRRRPTAAKNSQPSILYVGRISEQKNLHTLLLALWILKNRKPGLLGRIEIVGRGDDFGSPNMGMRSSGYETEVKELARTLGLEEQVRWHGFVDASALGRFYRRRHLCVSSSVHSDENFGVAVLNSLLQGNRAVLTEWGGHREFKRAFPDRITSIRVRGSRSGPFVCPFELAKAIEKGLNAMKRAGRKAREPMSVFELPAVRRAAAQLLEEIGRDRRAARPLENTLVLDSLRRRMRRLRLGNFRARAVFNDYRDPLARPFFETYGMKPVREDVRPGEALLVPPWVAVRNGMIRIRDPHRGVAAMKFGAAGPRRVCLRDHGDREWCVPLPIARRLFEDGYAFRMGAKGRAAVRS